MFTSNENDNKLEKDSLLDHDYVSTMQKNLTINLSGDEIRTDKHHGCKGDYYGYGLISKYKTRNKLSVFEFKGNEKDDEDIKSIISVLKYDIEYIISQISRIIPLSVQCGFALMSSMNDIIHQFPTECEELIQLLNLEGVEGSMMCTSNWVCENAETLKFHQEIDSSYTIISTPYWNTELMNKQDKRDGVVCNKGSANFIFKWQSIKEKQNLMYLPIEMDDGVSIFFSGYGCYHRQHRTNDGVFWNIASYQNRQFYHKLHMSIIRCLSPDITMA